MDAKKSDDNDTNSIPSSENTDISSEEDGILDHSSSSSDNDISSPSKKSEEEKDEYLSHRETVKNQHFDEAINLSVSSTDLSSPDKDSSLSENQLMRNNKFDEDIMEDTPSINGSSSDELDSRADAFRTTMGDDIPTTEKSSTIKKKNNNEQTLLNDRYDVAFDVHGDDDDDVSSSSIDTQPSEKSSSEIDKRINDNEMKRTSSSSAVVAPPDQSSYSSTFFQNQSQFSSQQQQPSSFDEDDVTSSSSTSGNSTQNTSYSTENSSSPYHHQPSTPTPPPNAYDPANYTSLSVPPEISELFQYITRYRPPPITIDNLPTELKCFIPPYIPAVGDVDPFLKMPRPDNRDDDLGLTVLDEIIPSRQSDAAVLELKLSASMNRNDRRHRRKNGRGDGDVVRSIENAAANKGEVETWIESVAEVRRAHSSAPSATNERGLVGESMTVELLEGLMEPWSEGFETALREGGVTLPSVDLDLSLEEYAKVLCSILDIPVFEGRIVESVHMMFNLFMEFQDNQHFSSLTDIASISAQNN